MGRRIRRELFWKRDLDLDLDLDLELDLDLDLFMDSFQHTHGKPWGKAEEDPGSNTGKLDALINNENPLKHWLFTGTSLGEKILEKQAKSSGKLQKRTLLYRYILDTVTVT